MIISLIHGLYYDEKNDGCTASRRQCNLNHGANAEI